MITKLVIDKGYGLHKWKGARILHFVSGVCSGDFLDHSLGTVADLGCREIVKNIIVIENITEHWPSIMT